MRSPFPILPSLLLFALAAHAKSPYLLSLDFGTDTLGIQTQPGLDTLKAYNDAKAIAGAADFGDSGYIQQEEFTQPTGPFTVEARIRPRAYGPLSTRFLSDIANTATWDNGPNQGFNFRLGGGYLYPVLPEGAYGSSSMYEQSRQYDNTYRAYMSQCLGEFDFATADGGTAPWLEAFTDRCVDLDRWTYMAAVWDGQKARIYLNGFDATDKWRPNGAGSQPFFNPTAILTVGARYGGKFDARHFSGSVDFIRILDTALSDAAVLQRYLDLQKDSARSPACEAKVIPIAPLPGEFCDSGCAFRFSLKAMGSCEVPGKDVSMKDGDSVDIEFSDDPGFPHPFLKLTVGQANFRIGDPLAGTVADYDGPCYWRGRLRPKEAAGPAAAKRAASAEPEWSEAKPFLLSYQSPASVRAVRGGLQSRLKPVAGGYLLEGLPAGSAPVAYRLDGRLAAKARARGGGSWFLPLRGEHGVFLIRTPQGIYRAAL
jgi:hypothetical protein